MLTTLSRNAMIFLPSPSSMLLEIHRPESRLRSLWTTGPGAPPTDRPGGGRTLASVRIMPRTLTAPPLAPDGYQSHFQGYVREPRQGLRGLCPEGEPGQPARIH